MVAVSAAVALAVSCGTTAEPEESAAELSGRVRQSNLDQSLASIRVQLRNDSAEPMDVDDVVLHAPPFPDVASDDDATIAPGRRIDFRFVYGEPTCSSATPTPEAATAQVVADGRPVKVDVEDSQNVLRRLLTLYCDRLRLAEVVTVELGETWTPDPAGDALLGTIELHRVGGDAEVTMDQRLRQCGLPSPAGRHGRTHRGARRRTGHDLGSDQGNGAAVRPARSGRRQEELCVPGVGRARGRPRRGQGRGHRRARSPPDVQFVVPTPGRGRRGVVTLGRQSTKMT